MNNWGGVKYFVPAEFLCPCCGHEQMTNSFISKLDNARLLLNEPMMITSGYRCKSYNTSLEGAENSRHLYGDAVDIQISGVDAARLVAIAVSLGFGGIGIRQHGKLSERFIHLDDRKGLPALWTYDAKRPGSS